MYGQMEKVSHYLGVTWSFAITVYRDWKCILRSPPPPNLQDYNIKKTLDALHPRKQTPP